MCGSQILKSRCLLSHPRSPKVTVDLSTNFIGGLSFQAPTPILAKNPNLTTLIVPNNGLSNESVVFFCRAVMAHPVLTTIDVSGNPITLPAGEALLQLVQRNPRITSINVANTNLDAAILKKMQRFVELETSFRGSHQREAKACRNSPNASSTPYERVLQEYAPKVRQSAAPGRRLRLVPKHDCWTACRRCRAQ